MKKKLAVVFLLIFSVLSFSQEKKTDTLTVGDNSLTISNLTIDSTSYMLRSPLKASLYSAVIPGLGQIYNKKYIKAPIALGLIGTGIGFVSYYNKRYSRYHSAYLAELSGQSHEFSEALQNVPSDQRLRMLANGQDSQQRNRNYAIVLTALAYFLNIVDATVDAHLSIFEKDKDLALKPVIINDFDSSVYNQKLGIAFQWTF
ncbi:MAG: DUF5683 domain-containing protein [Prevotellaceae bacterium]|jgi:hypothetical protein|nr:DUF5683 domain-containing protein [Prevotellaceae bacterium]